jgi:hypothetical protein
MKINELRSIVREVIAEEIANESVNKKKIAIDEIKRIISENELTAEELDEAGVLRRGFERLMGGGPNISKEFKLDGSYLKTSPSKNKDLTSVVKKLKAAHSDMTDDQAKEAAAIIFDSGSDVSSYNSGTYKSSFENGIFKYGSRTKGVSAGKTL